MFEPGLFVRITTSSLNCGQTLLIRRHRVKQAGENEMNAKITYKYARIASRAQAEISITCEKRYRVERV